LLEILHVSEQKVEQTSGEPGSLNAGPTVHHSSKAPSEPEAASAQESAKESSEVGSPTLVPEQGGAGETAEVDAAKADAAKPKADAPRTPGKVMIMSSGDRAWGTPTHHPLTPSGPDA